MQEIGARIKKVRQILKKSQQDLSNDLKITKQAISNVENGKCAPSIQLLLKLVEYGINSNYIIAGIGSMYLKDDKENSSLKNTIMKEVEKLLIERGIK